MTLTHRAIAALLLVLQGLAATSFGLVHASERVVAPAAIEAEHGNACFLVHDAARCPGCQAAGVAALPVAYRKPVAADARGNRSPAAALEAPQARPLSRATAPRAPPILSV
jgi:hypothetical protein